MEEIRSSFSRQQTTKFILITISLGFLLSSVDAVSVFTPADVRFSRHRCQESATTNETLRTLWKSGIFPNENQTHCFVKCVLEKLGLINLKNRGLNATKICDHFRISGPRRTMLEKWLNSPLKGTCVSYYEKLRKFEKYFFPKIKHVLYGVVGDPTYCEDKLVKCDKKSCMQDIKINWVPSIRDFRCQDYRIFKNFHFFDAYGRVDKNEIVRSFREAEKNLQNEKERTDKLAECVHFANSLFSYGPCRMATELKICLVRELPNAEYVFNYRNKILKFL